MKLIEGDKRPELKIGKFLGKIDFNGIFSTIDYFSNSEILPYYPLGRTIYEQSFLCPGDSGAPVMIKEDGEYKLLAIHTYAATLGITQPGDTSGYFFGTRIDSLYSFSIFQENNVTHTPELCKKWKPIILLNKIRGKKTSFDLPLDY